MVLFYVEQPFVSQSERKNMKPSSNKINVLLIVRKNKVKQKSKSNIYINKTLQLGKLL